MLVYKQYVINNYCFRQLALEKFKLDQFFYVILRFQQEVALYNIL